MDALHCIDTPRARQLHANARINSLFVQVHFHASFFSCTLTRALRRIIFAAFSCKAGHAAVLAPPPLTFPAQHASTLNAQGFTSRRRSGGKPGVIYLPPGLPVHMHLPTPFAPARIRVVLAPPAPCCAFFVSVWYPAESPRVGPIGRGPA